MSENKDRSVVQYLGRSFILGTARVYSRIFVVQYFPGEFFLIVQETEFPSYADHITPYRTPDTIDEVTK